MDEIVIVAKYANISYETAKTVTKQFDEDATIPFLVRYRKHLIGDLSSEDLRYVKQMYQLAKTIKAKAETIKKKIEAKGELTEQLKHCIDFAQSLPELEDLYAPYKTSKKTKASLLKEIGFDRHSENIIFGRSIVNPDLLVDKNNTLLKNAKAVDEMLALLVAEYLIGDKELENLVERLVSKEYIPLQCKQATESEKKGKVVKKEKSPEKKEFKKEKEEKFENYYNFSMLYKYVKPHQILAINRGEKKKMLSVKLAIPDSFNKSIENFCWSKWFRYGIQYDYRKKISSEAIKQLLSKKISPKIKRRIRTDLTRNGERSAIDVFSSNLKWLLLTRPVRPHDKYVVLGIDPGFKNGCKIAVMTVKREILDLTILHLENSKHFKHELKSLVEKHKVNTIALGNGQGCRQAEMIISQLISEENLDVNYCIVPEQGVSVYSCSKEAVEEYPDMKPNFVSAVSLTKRHLDPLSEFVKVEPKHLGVGMYQHDVDPKKLEEELGEVVSECVSNVGVDVNTAPLALLKRIAGLSEARAKKIIETREKNGGFTSRKELLDVKGIGPKTYQQCAGFIKIVPETCLTKTNAKRAKKMKPDFNVLDQTIIHPDDYENTFKIMKMANVDIINIGSTEFINKIKEFAQRHNLKQIGDELNSPTTTIQLICDALSTPLDFDIRSKMSAPLFKKEIKSPQDLFVGSILTGRVENVTPFGSFVDIGVGNSALIPNSQTNTTNLHLGQRVSVKITNIRGEKVSLQLRHIIAET